jgi:carbon-monoxide dehydrogenase small subunit
MEHQIELIVNGDICRLSVKPNETLVNVLRNKLKLTGTKEGCGLGGCGACTVIVNGNSVNSCLMLAVAADGMDITTIEGIAEDGNLHPIQKLFIERGAIQCGYCTPGMILSAKVLLDETPEPSEDQLRLSIAGNLCRCTGYVKIVEAIKVAAGRLNE